MASRVRAVTRQHHGPQKGNLGEDPGEPSSSVRGLFEPLPGRERLADPKLIVDDEKVGGRAGLEAAEGDAEQPSWTLRDGGGRVGWIEPECPEADEAVGEARGAAGEDAVGTSGDAVFGLDLDTAEPVGPVGHAGRFDGVGDEAAAAGGRGEGNPQELVGDV